MNIWKDAILKIINILLNASGTAGMIEISVCAAAAFLGAFLILKWTGKALGAAMSDASRVFVVVATAILLCLAAAAALDIYVVPNIKEALIAKWLPLATCGVIFLFIVIPIAAFLLKAKYFQALVAAMFSIGAAVGIVMLTHGLFGAIKAGDKEALKAKERTESVNEMLKK